MFQEIHQKIKKALNDQFIYVDELSEILATAICTKKNVILFGPGGHGKSEMAHAAVKAIYPAEDTFIQSLGEDTDEASFWGGLNLKKLKTKHVMEYFPENSMLNSKVAILEEIFDAPSVVLTSLKDTLTAKQLRKGTQVFDMKTEVIIGISNKTPNELIEIGGPSVQALMERFPLHHKVDWKTYDYKDYHKLLVKVLPTIDSELVKEIATLYTVINQQTGIKLSPRTAVHGADMIMKRDDKNFTCLTYLPGLENIKTNLKEYINKMRVQKECKKAMELLQYKYQKIYDASNSTNDITKLLKLAKDAESLASEVANTSVSDDLYGSRQSLSDTLFKFVEVCKQRAYNNV